MLARASDQPAPRFSRWLGDDAAGGETRLPTTQPIVNSLGMTLIPLAAGSFEMGLERSAEEASQRFGGDPSWYAGELPRHRVTLTRGFAMSDRHVTRHQFARFVDASGYQTLAEREAAADAWDGTTFVRKPGISWRNPGFDQANDHPAVCINHEDAVAFCEWLTDREGRRYRLPTEAAWEYAARAGTRPRVPVGRRSGRRRRAGRTPPTRRRANASRIGPPSPGAMATSSPPRRPRSGRMRGACSTWPATRGSGRPTGTRRSRRNRWSTRPGRATGTHRVLKGGSWYGAPTSCRASYRSRVKPGYRGSNVGFRVVADVDR